MATSLNPQEIYLLEQYTSLNYFGEMRDAWEKMLVVAEDALEEFMHKLPLDYRRRHQSEQPDVVWGQRVLPNFRDTMNALNKGFIEITHGNLKGLGYASAVKNDSIGQSRDYPEFWMTDAQSKAFGQWQSEASDYASNITTSLESWTMNDLRDDAAREYRYSKIQAFPPVWPSYKLNAAYSGKTDEIVRKTGIYLPEVDDSCAAFFIEGDAFYMAYVGIDPVTYHKLSEEPTTWTLVERASDSSNMAIAPSLIATGQLRCEAGQPCPQAGFWFTPAQTNSRRLFKQGDTMPSLGGDYGVTIWQWDQQQS
jgi:hypothetical protein